MLLETVRALIARFANRNMSKRRPPSSRTAAESTAVGGSESTAGTGTDAYNANTRPANEGQTAPAMLASAFFPNARDFVINISQMINSSGVVLQLLGEKRITGAEVDSSARDPPPKCHPDTRKSLRGRITEWLSDINRNWRMLWVIGPMGVGKSTVAQIIAEEAKGTGQLGAALFFSRSNHRDDPDGVIATLAYQLAVKSPEYKQIITQRLVDNPTILEKNRRAQFKELIIEPFQILMTQGAQIVQTPLLIILDGLDECRSKEAQCEFIELISEHTRQVDQFPLLWMVCSRPEWHLKGLLSHPDFHIACKREKMVIDEVESEEDVTLVLKDGFRDIYHKYRDYLEPGWPSEADFRQISSSASGHFAFASGILKYVGDPQHANPRAQLQTCIRFLGGSDGMPGAINPLHALDLLYRQVLSEVPKEILETTMHILGQIVLWISPLTVLDQANFLFIDQATFHRSLQHLHSVLDIPSAADAPRYELRFHHTSFKDFLLDSYRSGSFSINTAGVHYNMASLSLKWLNPPIATTGEKHGARSTNSTLKWVHPEVAEDKVLAHLREYSSNICWGACSLVDEEDLPKLAAQLEYFDSDALEYSSLPFIYFFPRLFKLANRLGEKSLMYQVTPENPATPNGTRPLRACLRIDIWEENLAKFGPHLVVPPRTSEGHVRLLFQFGKGDNARQLELVVEPWRAIRSYTADKSDEISFSQGEFAHILFRTRNNRWYVRKEDGTEGFVPRKCFVADLEFKYRARTLCSYVAGPDHPNRISFSKDEIVRVVDDSADWWEAEKSDGTRGLALSKSLALYVRSEYKARAVVNYTPIPIFKYELSFNRGEIVDVIEPDYGGIKSLWIVRKIDGTVGAAFSHLFMLIEK